MPGVRAVLALFERIMRELWVSGLIGGVLGGLVVVIALALVWLAWLCVRPRPKTPRPKRSAHARRRTPRPRRPKPKRPRKARR